MKLLKTTTKFLLFILFTAATLVSCNEKVEPGIFEIVEEGAPFNFGPSCDGKPIYEFGSLGEVQQEHRLLYNDFVAGNEEEQVLIDWEDAKNFYSLRKKDQEMDEGLIPDEPNFDPFQYTTDEIFETMLNEDGMIIIDGFLYLWDDGCVLHRMPYTDCNSYNTMLSFHTFLSSYSGTTADEEQMIIYRNDDQIEDKDVCADPRFDFETISELSVDVDNTDPPLVTKGTDCGYEAYIEHDVLSHDTVAQRISIRFEANSIAPIGSNPLYSFYVDNSSNFANVEITNASIPNLINTTWAVNGGDGYVYPGKWFVIEIDYSTSVTLVPFLGVTLVGSSNTVSGDSCIDTNIVSINLECPISISPEPISGLTGDYSFSMEGLEDVMGNYIINWNFGDGSPTVVTNNVNSVIHTFPMPCFAVDYTVTAIIEANGICDNSPQSVTITSGDRCKRAKTDEPSSEDGPSGRKARTKIKIKRRASIFGGGTKIKHKFRYRVQGTKNIAPSGDLHAVAGTACTVIDVSTLTPAVGQAGKKRLKQKYSSSNVYLVDLNTPYSVSFTHTDGYSKTLFYTETCSQ